MSIYKKAARGIHMKKFIEVVLVLSILLLTSISSAQGQTAYTSDTNIAHFTAGITSYATLSNFNNSDGCVDGSSFTPSSSELAATPCRVYNLPPSTPVAGLSSENNWILAAFSSPVSRIVVFPNIDHYGSAYDGYQYQIYGSNDYGNSEVPTWTKLFDATSVNACVSGCVDGGTGEPFTLGTSTGTPPSTVNNVETGGCLPGPVNSPGSNCVGYEAQFTFGTAYKYYAFGASTVAASNTEQEFSAVGTSSQTVTIQFTPSPTPETQIALIGNPTDPSAQSLALTLASVTNAINVSVEFFYEPTDLSTGTHGIGIADGVCELGATDAQDFDCRLASTFTYPDNGTLTAGDRLVPHIIPSHNNLGVWVRVIATLPNGSPAVAGRDYANSVDWYYAWNANPSLIPFTDFATTNAAVSTGPVNPEYQPGWNNQNPQMYDRPGTINGVPNPSIDFNFNITTFSKNCNPPPPNTPSCVGTADPGVGGHTITLNDVVAAAPPNPPSGTALGTVELQVPVPGISPFPYFKGLPMLVSFELENETTEASIANALTSPHSVSVATLDFLTGKNIPVQFPRGFPTTFTYNKFFKSYYIFLSPAPYTPGTKYTLQINSDLFPAPVTATFVVKRDF
jgi:hypothetical protein